MRLRCLIPAALTFAVIAVGAHIPPAFASPPPPIDGAVLTVSAASPMVMTLAAKTTSAADDTEANASFAATTSEPAVTRIALDLARLEVPWQTVDLAFQVDGAPVDLSVTADATTRSGSTQPWMPGPDAPLSIPAGQTPPEVSWNFPTAGTYTVRLTALLTVPPEHQATKPDDSVSEPPRGQTPSAESAQAPPAAPNPAEMTLKIHVTDPPAASDAAAAPDLHTDSSSIETQQSSPADSATPAFQPAEGAATEPLEAVPSVVSAGNIVVDYVLAGGQLSAQLRNSTTGETLDPTTTIFHMPRAEPTPADEPTAAWTDISQGRKQIYRTQAFSSGSNPLAITLDTAGIDPANTLPPGQSNILDGVFIRLSPATTPSFRLYDGISIRKPGSPTRFDSTEWMMLDPAGRNWRPISAEVQAIFLEPGRACVALEARTQFANTGQFTAHTMTVTFAIGDIEPTSVAPCDQVQPSAPTPPIPVPPATPEPRVLDAGLALVAPTIQNDSLNLGLSRVNHRGITELDPADVVLSVPHQDTRWPGNSQAVAGYRLWQGISEAGKNLWRTTGSLQKSGTYEQSNDLAVATTGAFLTAPPERTPPDVTMTMTHASTPSAQYVASYRTGRSGEELTLENTAFWDSRPGGSKIDLPLSPARPEARGHFTLSDAEPIGFAFSGPGTYCLTLQVNATYSDGETAQDLATLTFAVGIDPGTVTPCPQVTSPPSQPIPGEEPEEEFDPSVVWLDRGHLDIGLRTTDAGGLELVNRSDVYGTHALKDSVWDGTSIWTQFTVPPPEVGRAPTFLGPPGTRYWGFSSGSAFMDETLWPGISMEKLPRGYSARDFTWTFEEIIGPGDMYIWTTNRQYLNTSTGLPSSFSDKNSHVHQNWAFTHQGVYCVDISVRMRAGADPTTDIVARDWLTIAVGDADLSKVVPCGRTTPHVSTSALVPTIVPGPTVITQEGANRPDNTSLVRGVGLIKMNDSFDVASSVVRRVGNAQEFYDPEHVVYDLYSDGAHHWAIQQDWATLLGQVDQASAVTLSIGAHTGPGDVRLTRFQPSHTTDFLLDTTQDSEVRHVELWPGHMLGARLATTAPGVYCVPFTWSGQDAQGQPFEVTKTFTLAAGVADINAVRPCAEGAPPSVEPPGPDDPGTEEPEPSGWDVPNHSRTKSGAVIIAIGHVDVSSTLDGGELHTLIKDDSDPMNPGVMRDPDTTVMQLRPESQTVLPDLPQFAFLGTPGDPIWLAPETQNDAVIWPGWSTEAIAINQTATDFEWRLTDKSGPGDFALFQTAFSSPTVLFNTRDGITAADSFTIPKRVHAHGSWAFTHEGHYCLAFERTTRLPDNSLAKDDFVLAISVGKADVTALDPSTCFTDSPTPPGETEPEEPGAPPGNPGAEPGGTAPPSPPPGGGANPPGTLPGLPQPTPPLPPATTPPPPPGCVPGKLVLDAGHIDYSSHIRGGRLASLLGEDTSGRKVLREPDDVVLWLKPQSKVTLPGGYGAVGAPGTTVWQVPQTQNQALIWLGWSTENLNAGNASGPVNWSLDRVEGPGKVTVYLSDVFGGVQRVIFPGQGSSTSVDLGHHVHGNWAFTKPGVYRLTMTQTVGLPGGGRTIDTETVTIAVGDVDIAKVAGGTGTGCGTTSKAIAVPVSSTRAGPGTVAGAAAGGALAAGVVAPAQLEAPATGAPLAAVAPGAVRAGQPAGSAAGTGTDAAIAPGGQLANSGAAAAVLAGLGALLLLAGAVLAYRFSRSRIRLAAHRPAHP